MIGSQSSLQHKTETSSYWKNILPQKICKEKMNNINDDDNIGLMSMLKTTHSTWRLFVHIYWQRVISQ